MEDILNDFREHIGLRGHCHQASPLVEWRIPHVYLWNPSLLQRPVDWGRELSVAGYVTLKDEREMEKMRKFKWSRSLNDFTLESCNPVLYFGVSTYCLESLQIDQLLRQIDEAAEQANVKIIFQAREGRSGRSLYHSENIYEVESDFPYSLILRKVAATIHWGEPAIVEEGLAAGKPVGICVSVSSQYYAACMCVTAGVGIPPIDLRKCTVESLVSSFKHILQPEIRDKAQEVSQTFQPKQALEKAVESFYMNLPLRAMRCDIDKDKVARIYDPRLELKLSFEAYIAIQPLRTHDDTDDVSYKPLWYDGRRPAKFSLRDIAGDHEPRDQKPIHGLESIRKALTSFASHESTDSAPEAPRSVLSRLTSRVAMVVEKPQYWSTPEQEVIESKAIVAAYERALQQRATQQPKSKPRKRSMHH
ncbi:bZIP transcription factor 1 [Phytophthora nicotianae]|uniref:BZIP transcription factor 1 n=1 Tax=Phytophthora nicotianae TaxID=4792 RepID=A0A0W8D7F5_PHYNI|nr:bZIP transcription factor 1 [Phytophthora nicotianae]